jgi:hypothetical protein
MHFSTAETSSSSIPNIPFECKHSVKITGIGVTRADHLLLCNNSSTDVMVLSHDGKQLNKISLEGRP